MIASPLVVVVDTDPSERRHTEKALEGDGFVVTTADSFADAKALLAGITPDLVIADIKLGAFNGLHLAALCAIWRPGTPFIATYETYDWVLEADARRLSALYILKAPAREELLRAARTLLDGRKRDPNGVRRSYRKLVPEEIVAQVGASRAHVVNVSYGGVKLKLEGASGAEHTPLPENFEIVFPELDLSLHAAPIWASLEDTANEWLCGADISQNESEHLQRWRQFVDSVG